MTRIMKVAIAACVFSLLTSLGTTGSAFALDQTKWANVCTNFLGLRSAANQVDTAGAGYGMDNGNKVPMDCLRPAPANWDTLLAATVERIKAFPDSGGRFLVIVSGCPGVVADYPDSFPKCNRVTGVVVVATPQTMNNYSSQQLIGWVVEHL